MYPFQTKIFVKSKWNFLKITPFNFFYILVPFFIFITIELFPNTSHGLLELLIFILICTAFAWASVYRENNWGTFIGELIIIEDEIIVLNEKFNLANNCIMEFSCTDYKDKKLNYRYGPKYSQGVSNTIQLKLNDKVQSFCFLLEDLEHKNHFINVMKEQLKKGRFSLQTYYTGAGLNYDEIQQLKKEL